MHDPQIQFITELGTIVIELYPEQAPLTVNNFLRYVVEDRFADSCFYRVVRADNQPHNKIKIAVIQGGLQVDEHPLRLPPISHETTQQTGLRHADGTLSMARNEPGSASSEFVICLGDHNPNWISAASAAPGSAIANKRHGSRVMAWP